MKKNILLTGLLLLLPVALIAEESVSPAIETISDVNFEFLMGNPKTAWGPDLFNKKPGFAEFAPIEEKYTLQGIAYNPSGSTAIIDGKAVRSGDIVGERKVIEIAPSYVVLEKGDSQIQLVLSPRRKNQ
jgi:hypothetical protein